MKDEQILDKIEYVYQIRIKNYKIYFNLFNFFPKKSNK